MASIAFELLIPNQRLVAVDASMVILPGSEGDVGVLPNHAPLMCALREGGTLKIVTEKIETGKIETGSKTLSFTVTGGFAEALPDRCTVLASSAEPIGKS